MEEAVAAVNSENVENKPEKLTRMKLRHREIITQLVYYPNKTIGQIAEELGFNPGHVSHIINSPMFQIELQKELRTKQHLERESALQTVATKGTEKLIEAVTKGKLVFEDTDQDGVPFVREKVLDGRDIVNIVHDALDRVGHKPAQKVIQGTVDLGAMIMQAHKDEGDVIDVEVTKNERVG